MRAQRRVSLDVIPPAGSGGAPTVTTTNLFADPDMRDLLRSGFPASLRFRLELWRAGGLFNNLESQQEWELIVQYDPSAQRYRVVRRQHGRVEDLGSFATLSTAQAMLERPLRAGLLPGWSGPTARAGRAGGLRGLDRAATARNHTARAGPVACSVGRAAVARVQGGRSPVRELWWAHDRTRVPDRTGRGEEDPGTPWPAGHGAAEGASTRGRAARAG